MVEKLEGLFQNEPHLLPNALEASLNAYKKGLGAMGRFPIGGVEVEVRFAEIPGLDQLVLGFYPKHPNVHFSEGLWAVIPSIRVDNRLMPLESLDHPSTVERSIATLAAALEDFLEVAKAGKPDHN